MDKKQELMFKASSIAGVAYQAGWLGAIKHLEGRIDRPTTLSLVRRFAELYDQSPISDSQIEEGRKLWRDYYVLIGQHMILTDEGWEDGTSKAAYLESADGDEGVILDEVNAPA